MQRILLPTDGSPLSEQAIPVAATIAGAQGAEVVVARIVRYVNWFTDESEGYLTPELYDDLVATLDQDAQQSLDRVIARLHESGVTTQTELLHGTPAAGLLDLEQRVQPDLVIMATHGRTGLARFALGSVSDRMVREGSAPVLLVRALAPAASALQSALLPLDGSLLAEQALPMVEALAGKPLRSISLLRAIAVPEEQAMAMEYLGSIADRLSPLGLELSAQVDVDAPDLAIERAAERVDLAILSTHGRGGFDRLRHGSVAERATRHLTVPTLLVRASEPTSAEEPEPAVESPR